MKIISKFKDYYDRVLAHGQDDRIPYVRLTETFPTKDLQVPIGITLNVKPGFDPKGHPTVRRVKLIPDKVYVCGKAYRYLRAEVCEKVDQPTWHWNWIPDRLDYFYSVEQLSKFVEPLGFLVKDIYSGRMFGQEPEYAYLDAFLSAQGTEEAMAYLIEKRLVVLRKTGHDGGWVNGGYRNPEEYWEHNFPLKDIQFYKLMDPYQVYQELDMYVCGVLGQQAKEVIKISDKDRIYQHGFDRYSFRKPPEEGKRKK